MSADSRIGIIAGAALASSAMSRPPSTTTPAFSRADLDAAPRELLRDGRWANARVERIALGGALWTLKDFAPRSFLVRNTIGRCLVRRELRMLARLRGIDGIPHDAFRVDGHALAARHLPGTLLSSLPAERVSTPFLEALETLLLRVHACGVVHLDTGGGSNLLMQTDGSPGLIDFQAALSTRWMPGALRSTLEGIDLRGIYKKWLQLQPQSLGEARRARFEQAARWRRLWILRGYFGVRRRSAMAQPAPGP